MTLLFLQRLFIILQGIFTLFRFLQHLLRTRIGQLIKRALESILFVYIVLKNNPASASPIVCFRLASDEFRCWNEINCCDRLAKLHSNNFVRQVVQRAGQESTVAWIDLRSTYP